MDISTILAYVSEYGLATVIAVVLILFIIGQYKMNVKFDNDRRDVANDRLFEMLKGQVDKLDRSTFDNYTAIKDSIDTNMIAIRKEIGILLSIAKNSGDLSGSSHDRIEAIVNDISMKLETMNSSFRTALQIILEREISLNNNNDEVNNS